MTGDWGIAVAGLVPPFALALFATGRGAPPVRLAAFALLSALAAPLMVALCFFLDQPSAIDLALTLVVLTVPASLLFALFEERWI